ncbi:DUF2326 domain-containing protein [uncultured Bacteroides sp.]|uniref:DUF2326 domain-containing protein n=1 Tax=uncultured Bacteroides sp. TaxID=162156 RepID=UPI002AA90C67|nr:DUF2326 domain-containing protein [uncultured Bacteroides sp.]
MKLSQLYSNKNTFKHIVFNKGINVVLGKVTKKYDLAKDSHNLGKSTLISVLDFMLLKDIDKNHFFRQFNSKFNGLTLYLEIILNSGEYLTICRSIDDPNKISFKKNDARTVANEATKWDVLDLSLTKSITQLDEYLHFDVLQTWKYRKSVTYFLRGQKDYNDIFQLGKYQNGKHVDWKPFMFDLLGFDGNLLTEKYELDGKIENNKTFINAIEKEFSVNKGDIDKINGRISLKHAELEETKRLIDSFNFYQQERSLNKNLIDNIEASIAELNSLEYSLSYDLDKAQKSISNTTSFDIEQLKEIYADVNVFFPSSLIQDYKALERFNKDITEERNRYLKKRIKEISAQLEETREKLKTLNEQRNGTLNILQNKDSFKKFKSYQISLAKIEGDISQLEEQLKNIDKIASIKDIVSELKGKLDTATKKIEEHIKYQDNTINTEIKKTFNNVFRTVFNVSALLYVSINSSGNIEFYSEVANEDDESRITAESNGNTYRKMLCVAFDLAVLIAYNKKSFYRFVYHDGVLEGLDNRPKRKFIKLIREYCQKYDIQYIFTSIEDDLPSDILDSFTDEEKCLILDDSGDEGKLFGFSY